MTEATDSMIENAAKRNGLADASSPYLLQHATNPVDWLPWGREALERARAEDKPIFLSIGYSACHWCHVMAHESFENSEIARFLNEHFVNIKVDREERPDLDALYMSAVQLMNGQGGWPLSVFLTPQRRPFYGGTYFPPEDRWGRVGFRRVLENIDRAWAGRRDDLLSGAKSLAEAVQRSLGSVPPNKGAWSDSVFARADERLVEQFDTQWGGFGGAPKFPPAGALDYLLRRYHQRGDERLLGIVTQTLVQMAAGGMYDHLGGGFHRYAVDREWRVPHFEKMLYDNALLVPVYLDASLVTGDERFRDLGRETLDYVVRHMTDRDGGFHAAEDADSEGQEGRYYVWTRDEILRELGDETGKSFCRFYSVSDAGNFEGSTILMLADREAGLAEKQAFAQARRDLLVIREQRTSPGRDDKIIAEWNGMMIAALCRGYQVLGDSRYLGAAATAASYILSEMVIDGRLQRARRGDRCSGPGYLADYAQLIRGLLALYESDFDVGWLRQAQSLADRALERFSDPAGRGFFFAEDGSDDLLVRSRPVEDGSIPSGNSAMAGAMLKLYRLVGSDAYRIAAESALGLSSALAAEHPRAVDHALGVAHDAHTARWDVVLAGRDKNPALNEMAAHVRSRYLPGVTLAATTGAPDEVTKHPARVLLEGKTPLEGEVTAYVCVEGSCKKPMTDVQELDTVLVRRCRTGVATR